MFPRRLVVGCVCVALLITYHRVQYGQKSMANAIAMFDDREHETVTYEGAEIKFDLQALLSDSKLRHETLHKWSHWSMFTGTVWRAFVDRSVGGMQPPIKEGDSVFETGCGVGAALQALIEAHGSLAVGGVDLSKFQVEVASKVLAKHAKHAGAFAHADGRELPLSVTGSGPGSGSGLYDHAIALGVVCYLDTLADVRDLLREMLAVCRPGGSLAVGMVPPNARSLNSCSVSVPQAFWEDLQAPMGFVVTGFSRQKDWTDTYGTIVKGWRSAEGWVSSGEQAVTGTIGGGGPPHFDQYTVWLTKAEASAAVGVL